MQRLLNGSVSNTWLYRDQETSDPLHRRLHFGLLIAQTTMRDDLENDMMDAFRLGNEDPALAMKRFGRIRSRALAAGRQALATSCLIQMRFLAGLQGDVCEELRLLERIVDEAPNAMHLVSLGERWS